MITNKIHISQSFGGRLDPLQFHPERMNMIRHISESCEWCKLKEVVENVKTITKTFSDTDVYIGLENIVSNTGEYIPTSNKDSISSAAVFKKGDILFPKLRPYLNKVYRADFNGKCSTEFHVFNAKGIDADYLTIVLRSNMILAQTKHMMTGNTLPRLQTADIENLIIPRPSSDVQRAIVEIYTKAQSQKQTRNTRAKRLLEYANSYFLKELGISIPKTMEQERSFKVNISDLIGKRLNPYSHNSNALQLTKLIASNNNAKTVLSQLITNSIAGDWGIDDYEEIDDNYTKCLVLRATEFDNKYNLNIDNGRIKYRMIRNSKLNKMSIQDGDILIEKSGGSIDQPVGRVAYIDDNILKGRDICYSNFIHKITIDSKLINPKYVYYYLSTMYSCGLTESIQSQTNGIRNLIMGDYLNTSILLPLEKKQIKIVNKIDRIYRLAKMCDNDAIEVLETAKQKIETMILG